jgi:hypothetical protein
MKPPNRIVQLLAIGVIAGLLATGCAEPPTSPAPGRAPASPTRPASPQPNTPSPAAAAPAKPAALTAGPADSEVVSQAKSDLAKRIGVAVGEIKTRSVEEVNWPDASLGCPEPDMMYAQVVTPGQRIVLEAGDQMYEYHSGGANVVFCPPHAKRK